MRRALILLAALASWQPAAAADVAGELRQAQAEAQQWAGLVAERPCPGLGDTSDIKGFETPERIRQAAATEWAFVDRIVASLPELDGDPALDERTRMQLRDTRLYYATASAARWVLAQLALAARVDPTIGTDQPHPMTSLRGEAGRMTRFARSVSGAPAGVAGSLDARLRSCLASLETAVVDVNREAARSAVEEAKTVAALDRTVALYGLGQATGDLGEAIGAKRQTLRLAEERLAALEAERTRQADAARQARDAASQKTAQAARAKGLAVMMGHAKAFAAAINSGNRGGAVAHLTDDVAVSTPFGSDRGKSAVSARLASAFGSGKSGRFGVPYDNGAGIVCSVSSAQGNGTLSFGFAADGRINFMRLQ